MLTLPLLLAVRIRIGGRGSGAFQMPFPTESPPWKGVVPSLLLLEFSNSLLYSLVPGDIPDSQISGFFFFFLGRGTSTGHCVSNWWSSWRQQTWEESCLEIHKGQLGRALQSIPGRVLNFQTNKGMSES